MRLISVLCFLIATSTIFGQAEKIWMHPNRGQWHENIQYKVGLDGGEMLLEKQGFTYAFHNAGEVYGHKHDGAEHDHKTPELKGHAIRAVFVGSNSNPAFEEKDFSTAYRNYFIGNDPSKWKSEIRSAGNVLYKNLYPSIDMEVVGDFSSLKYSFIVAPGKNPDQIKMKIDGAKSVFIDKEGNLHTQHPFGEIIETAPTAWTIDANGKKKSVAVRFSLKRKVVSYDFPEDYDHAQTLIIDPQLTFSTFSGSTADNWGFTAAPDANSKVFAAGIVFTSGYPITTGAYDPIFNGGIDIGVTKFNETGSSLIYSTYIGGSATETPHSIICNANNELYIMGATSSINFPVPGSPYDATFNNGTNFSENGLDFINGSDIYIAKLNSTGTSLLAATFIGGSGNDGINIGLLKGNYGDQFRGDITLDATGNVYVTSNTRSADFPAVNGFQPFLSGIQDAVIFKLNPTLTTLMWSTFFGGNGLETGNSLQIASNGEVYITGGTTSPTLGFPSTGHSLTNNGGRSDGYLIRISGGAPFLLSGTFIGTSAYDQSYFVQLDLNNQVYVFGQSEGNMPITPGKYGRPNSGQFIRKYNTNLSALAWSTCIGAGTGFAEISPTAFLVSNCFEIYISGWGGSINTGSAPHSSTNGFETTPGAFQTITNGSNFYIAVLKPDAASLSYATFMGGMSSSSNHVDGGTSRFDKAGRIYHAVCGACSGQPNGFTTTPNAWSKTNKSTNCNLAVFKFELNHINAVVGQPAPLICIPDPVVFSNSSSNGNTFHWNFGDNTTSNLVNPSHLYPGPGTYEVTLVVSDSSGCFSADTTRFTVNIGQFNGQVTAPASPVCPGTPYQFNASGGTTYLWSPANLLNNAHIANPIATITETTVFTVVITDPCGSNSFTVTLPVVDNSSGASLDTSICIGNSVPLFASGGTTYVWSPAGSLSNPNIANPIATPTQTTTYQVVITTAEGCVLNEKIVVEVILTPPNPVIPDTVGLCIGLPKEITVSGASKYFWSPPVNITPLTGPVVTVNPPNDMMYYCNFVNACGEVLDSVYVELVEPNVQAGFDTTICPGNSTPLFAFGGVSYEWKPANTLNSSTGSSVIATPTQNTTYYAIGIDENGCVDTGFVTVTLFPQPFIQTSPDVYAFFGDVIQLSATSTTPGPYIWNPAEFLSCVVCKNPVAVPNKNMQYTVTYTDQNGCSASDSVQIFYDAIIYVPNTFTPEGNLFNEVFKAVGGNIKTFEMTIYNRWGEKIITLNSLDESWDGSYKGMPCQDGTYVWKIAYKDFSSNKEHKMVGHINLIR